MVITEEEDWIHTAPITYHYSHLTSEESAPGVTRTPDRRIRNPLLYPAELRAQIALQYVAAKERKSSPSLKHGWAGAVELME
jgi:hypothetical protein